MDALTSGIKSVSNQYFENNNPFKKPDNTTSNSQVNQNGNLYQAPDGSIPQQIIVLLGNDNKVTHADKMNIFLLAIILFLVIILAVRG